MDPTNRWMMRLTQNLGVLIIALTLTACDDVIGGKLATIPDGVSHSTALQSLAYDLNAYPAHKLVCDPLDPGTPPSVQHGIRSSLFYKTADQPVYHNVLDMVSKTRMSDQALFFSQLNVPTRLFESGFSTEVGGLVKDDQGQKLIEYFALKFNTEVTLGPDDAEGTYEFATLADDGVRVGVLKNGIRDDFINSDGDHPTQMGCATTKFVLKKGDRLPLEMLYYQGPRYHIALVLLWRKITDQNQGPDPLCGQNGNSLFFNPDQNSAPQQAYRDLLSRGWAPVDKANFIIPDSQSDTNTALVAYNPCFQGLLPVISNFHTGEILFNDAFVFWSTDIPATSQILLIETASGATTLTTSDNLLSLDHQIHLTGLKSKTEYQIQALSVSADMGRAIGPALLFTTP